MSGEAFSTDRVFFQQQQADHHNVDVCPNGAILEKTGNLQKESHLVKQQYSPAVVQVRESEVFAGVSAAPKKRRMVNLATSSSSALTGESLSISGGSG